MSNAKIIEDEIAASLHSSQRRISVSEGKQQLTKQSFV